MKTAKSSGRKIEITLTAAAKSGDVQVLGGCIAVLQTDGAIGDKVTGVFQDEIEFNKEGTDTFTAGDKAFYITANKTITSTVGSNAYAGLVTHNVASGDTKVRVAINAGSNS